MGVDVLRMERPLDEEVRLFQATEVLGPIGEINRTGSHYVFAHSDNNSLAAVNRILRAGGEVSWALDEFDMDGTSFAKGAFVVDANSVDFDTLRGISRETHIPMTGGIVGVESKPLTAPRIAVYKSWVANMDAGWIRYILERYDFEYQVLTDAEVRAGSLEKRFDVVILSDQGSGSIINGHRKGTIHPDYVGGITTGGVENLKRFVRAGGTLISNKNSNDLVIDAFRLPLRNVLRGISRNEFNIPGAVLRMNYVTDHPIAFGMPEEGAAYFAAGARGYEIVTAEDLESEEEEEEEGAGGARGQRGQQTAQAGQRGGRRGGGAGTSTAPMDTDLEVGVAARYPDDALLISGWQIGEENLYGKIAVAQVRIEEGNAVLFGFNVHNRAQAYGTFKLLFNAIYNR
jgi:hypothetical protein